MDAGSKEFRPNVSWDPEVAAYLRDALGEQRFAAIAAALARPPTTTCLRVNTLKTTTEAVVSLVREQLGPEWPRDTVQVHPQVPCAVLLRGSGPHSVDYGPAGCKEVLVSRKAGEAVLRGAPVYAPGVLAVSSGVGRGELVALAVARERPGSDTPEVTRGTTLYDTPRAASGDTAAAPAPVVTAGDGRQPDCVGEVAGPSGGTAAGAARRGARDRPAASGLGSSPVAAVACGTGCAGGAASPRKEADAGAEEPAAAAPAARQEDGRGAGLSVRARRRQRQRERTQEAGEAGARHVDAGAAGCDSGRQAANTHAQPHPRIKLGADGATPAPPPAPPPQPQAQDARDARDTAPAASGYTDPRAEPDAKHSNAEDGDTGPATGAAAVPQVQVDADAGESGALPAGWTASSQGPVPPRTGMYVGLARTAMSRQEMFRANQGLAVELVEPVFRVPPAAGQLPRGWSMLQNLPSLVAALALAPTPGSRVLDMCAAPGGKTTLLAQIMGDRGEVVAWDRTHAKVAEIVSLAEELGVTCIRPHKMDAGKAVAGAAARAGTGAASAPAPAAGPAPEAAADEDGPRVSSEPAAAASCDSHDGCGCAGGAAMAAATAGAAATSGGDSSQAAGGAAGEQGSRPALSEKARLREERRRAAMLRRGITPPPPPEASSAPAAYPPESFDSVLLDAPCSALGLRPRLQQHAGPAYLRQCAAAQRRLVDSAVRLLRPGGCLVYSTCTFNPGENEAVVRYLLDTYGSSFRLVPAGPPFLGGPGLTGRHPTRSEVGVPLGAGAASAAATAAAGACAAAVDACGADDRGAAAGNTERRGAVSLAAAGVAGGAAGVGAAAAGPKGRACGLGEAWLTEGEARMVQRFDPSDPQLDCIGFFVAKFLKTASLPTGQA